MSKADDPLCDIQWCCALGVRRDAQRLLESAGLVHGGVQHPQAVGPKDTETGRLVMCVCMCAGIWLCVQLCVLLLLRARVCGLG